MLRQSMQLLGGSKKIILRSSPPYLLLCSSMAIFAAAAAAKLVPPSPLLAFKISGLGPAPTNVLRQHHPCLMPLKVPAPKSKKPAAAVALSSLHELTTTSNSMYDIAENVGYSLASYYTSLGLFVISVPGLWSLIKRSAKSKIVQKTFVEKENKAPNQVAGEILSFFTRNNFVVSNRGEAITFEGIMTPSRGQAALLVFCTCISLGSVALVLTITVPEGGNNWFWLTALSPLAGAYYWRRASRKEQIKVKMIVGDNGTLSEIIVQGDDVQVEEMRKELKLSEKGMVYVKGIFER